ncbi:MAG: preprotein translocase subunit SecE [Anaerolineae bacterium CG2_30_57_67]|nr:MAG: preprotein translocase subunit SecE [Anaerolineae bacterium CG2_30_57_67]
MKQPNAVARFYRETVGELRKVNWPTWPDAKNLTGIVILVLVVMAVYLSVVDAIGAWFVNLILGV